MKYELLKKLVDAGFPKAELPKYSKDLKEPDYLIVDYVGNWPTLSELIEACEDEFAYLKRHFPSGIWEAATDGYEQQGSTPEEAVANLWLSIKNNNEPI